MLQMGHEVRAFSRAVENAPSDRDGKEVHAQWAKSEHPIRHAQQALEVVAGRTGMRCTVPGHREANVLMAG
jgi:hypothetical protein